MSKKLVKIGGKLLITNKLISHQPKPFILKMDTTKQDWGNDDDPEDDEVTLHLNSDLNYDFTVDWGDGTTQDVNNDDVANLPETWGIRFLNYKYNNPGEKIVKIYGVFGGLYLNWGDGQAKYMEVTQWGDPYWESTLYAFGGCENLKIIATDVPNWQNVTDFGHCFSNCTSLETIPSNLFDNCTEVTTFYRCFRDCTSLETIPSGLFNNCTKVTIFWGCFWNCTSLTSLPDGLFDNNIKVTNFRDCFRDCTPITSIPNGLFDNCTEVTNFGGCFGGTSITSIPNGLFDNNIEATHFDSCFRDCASLETIPTGLFDYNTEVTSFAYCFRDCASLNLSGITVDTWNVSNVINMRSMFQNCTIITDIPGIEQWEPFKINSSAFQGMRDMLLDTTLPTKRYSDMLINFADKADQFENTGIYLHGGNSKYNSGGEEARNTLTSSYGWNITDGGPE